MLHKPIIRTIDLDNQGQIGAIIDRTILSIKILKSLQVRIQIYQSQIN